jgi:hypothetical protein
MAASDKILKRIENLLRLAAPTSNTTEAERSNAALEAARLIQEHAVSVRPEDPPAPPKRSQGGVVHGAWVLTQALQWCNCSHCNNKISQGDIVWVRVLSVARVDYRHNCKPCKPQAAE